MTACFRIKFGAFVWFIVLICALLREADSTRSTFYTMERWRNEIEKYCPTQNISISCRRGFYIHILDAHRKRRQGWFWHELSDSIISNITQGWFWHELSDSIISNITAACDCSVRCNIPKYQGCINLGFNSESPWTLRIRYQCRRDGCSDNTGSTTTSSPDTSTTDILSSGGTNATIYSASSTTQLPTSTTTESEKYSSEQSITLETTTESTEHNEPSSSEARGATYNTTVHTSNEPQFDLHSNTDEKNTDKVTIAVCVSIIGFGLAGCILAVILYRRWRKKKSIDSVYYNNTATDNADTGFTNLTYSETSSKVDGKHDDTDSGYTDMRVDDPLDDTNEYYSIKDGKEETMQTENDNYYAIKDNASQDYNKITFRPKSIPEDPSYVHTPRATNITDKTYDHVDGKECMKTVLQDDDYSHLSQSKTHACNNKRCTPFGEAFKEDGAVVDPNEGGEGYTSDHKYFTLEMSKHSRQTEVEKENDVSHGYFVLEKEIPTKIDFADESDVSKTPVNTALAIQKRDSSTSSTDQVYFENCRQTDAESDSHQYQGLGPHTSELMDESVENVNHDYFVLDKETNETETDKETDISHNYFVLEEAIPAKNNSKDDSVFSKTPATVHATSVVQEMKSFTPSSDHPYFETRLQVGIESDAHQYQALEQNILEPNDE